MRIRPLVCIILLSMLIVLLLSGLFSINMPTTQAQGKVPSAPEPWKYEWAKISSDFDYPIYLTHAGDGSQRLFGVEQSGQIFIIQDGKFNPTPFLDLGSLVIEDILSGGYSERGLLGLVFHPQYKQNGLFFVHYNNKQGDTIIARYKVSSNDANRADPQSAKVLMTVKQPYDNHKGGQLAFGRDGFLYIGLGDGGSTGDPQGYGQNKNTKLGKVLRIDVNTPDSADPNALAYAIPPSNPFVNQANTAPEIWAYGLRNPWRFSFDRETGDLYIGDVGDSKIEEINFQPAESKGGENYGWNYFEGLEKFRTDPEPEGLVKPFHTYTRAQGCAVVGGYVYRGNLIPALRGVYFFADYCTGRIWSAFRDAAGKWQIAIFTETKSPISSFGENENGELYLVGYKTGIFRLKAK